MAVNLLNKLFIEDLDVKGKRVLMRVDFNVPLDENLNITSDKRIVAALPSIKYVIENGGKLILMSHLGRPKGQRIEKYSLKPVAKRLSELLGKEVIMAPDCIGEEVENIVNNLKEGDVVLLENVRFYKEETDNNPEFAKKLASLGDVYVNDAFGTAHRAHASTVGVTQYIAQCAMGYLMKKEVEFLVGAVENPQRPFVAIIGGAKISGKIDVIKNLLPKVDKLLIGGGMAYTFYKAMGYEIGKSILEEDKIDLAKELLELGKDKIELPVDVLITNELDFDGRKVGETKYVKATEIPTDWEGIDIGPETIKKFSEIILSAKTIVWNGPMGIFEIDESAKGTIEIANALAKATQENGAITIVGGGDSASAIKKAGVEDKISHVSTGGGASLELLEGKELPGLVALTDK